jgi:hypothetical protein
MYTKTCDLYQESTLQDILNFLSNSKKSIEVLSFVRNVLASLNKKFATFSEIFPPSSKYLSFACIDKKMQSVTRISWKENFPQTRVRMIQWKDDKMEG